MKRNAKAIWTGTGKEGAGKVSTASGVLQDSQYSYNTRFENGKGTNPEELIAAAHAGCFSMKLAFNIDKAGYKAEKIETSCDIDLSEGAITSSQLKVSARIADIEESKFQELVNDAKENCPVSKLLNTNISVEAKLN